MGKSRSPTQGLSQGSSRLTAVAKRWAEEVDQDYLVVASILWRLARGDYVDKDASVGPDPNLRLLLSGPQNFVSISSPAEQGDARDSGEQRKARVDVPRPVGEVTEYLVPHVEDLLADFDPPIEREALVAFCVAQQIPLPPFLTTSETAVHSAGTSAFTTPTQHAIRKATTSKRHQAWQKAFKKLKRKHPDKSDRWIAGKIGKLPIAAGRAVDTIRRNMKPR